MTSTTKDKILKLQELQSAYGLAFRELEKFKNTLTGAQCTYSLGDIWIHTNEILNELKIKFTNEVLDEHNQ